MKHTDKELAEFQQELQPLLDHFWNLLGDGPSQGGEGVKSLTHEQFVHESKIMRDGIFLFLVTHLDLDVALRVQLMFVMNSFEIPDADPENDRQRANELYAWAKVLHDTINVEAMHAGERALWWLIDDDGEWVAVKNGGVKDIRQFLASRL